jgi:hypothetical protein
VAFTGLTRAEVRFKVVCHTVSDPGLGAGTGMGLDMMDSPRSRSLAEGAEPSPYITMTAAADYPTLRVTDVACDGVAKPVLWRQLSVSALNRQLAQPPSPVEGRLQRRGGADGSLVSERALAPLSGVAAGLGVAVEGAEPTAVYLEVSNTGALPLDWKILLRNEVEVEMENWVDLGEPSREMDAHQRFIVEQGVMEVAPRAGVLAPGERQPVRVLYRHQHVGHHSLTALLAVKHGRSVRLELEGRTVVLDAKCLSTGPAAAAVHVLAPVVIGEREPPLQTMELRNPCPQDVHYHVDLDSIRALNVTAWDFPVLTCQNPRGVIPAFGAALVNWVFQPVEAKTYECAVQVHIEGGEMSEITLRGVGTVPRAATAAAAGGVHVTEVGGLGDGVGGVNEGVDAAMMDADRSSWLGYQPSPTLPPPGDFQLSTHACAFGAVPALSVNRRVVLLRSTAAVDYDFQWDLCAMGGAEMDGVVTVEPKRGLVLAGGTVFCKVVYTAGAKPQVFDGSVRCQLSPASPTAAELAGRVTALEEEASREEVLALHGRSASGVLTGFASKQRVSVVHAATMASTARHPDLAVAGALEHLDLMPPLPLSPGHVTLALGVEGCAAPEVQYREEHGAAAANRFFVPSFRPTPVPAQLPALLNTDDAANVIAALLHDTLSDPAIRRGFDSLEEEAIPYYVQTRRGRGGGGVRGAAAAAATVGSEAADAAAASVDTADTAAAFIAAEGAVGAGAVAVMAAETVTAAEEEREGEMEAADEGGLDDAEVRKAQANPEFREVAEWVLEATLYNLVKELHAQQQQQERAAWEEEVSTQGGTPWANSQQQRQQWEEEY